MQSCKKMKTLIEHIIRWMPAVMSLLALASCQKDEGVLPVASTDGQQLSVVLRVPSNAPQEGEYEPGSTYENYIDMSDDAYRIYFFTADDNTLIARFEAAEVVPVEGRNYVDYTLLGAVPDELVNHSDFKIVILANWPAYDDDALTIGTTTITDICNADWARFDFPLKSFELGPDNLIPFYGVHTYEEVTFKPNVATLLDEPITLLRAMAKVEVILETDDYFNLAFDWVRMNRYNQTGYCAPDADSEDDYDHNGVWADDYAGSLHLVTGSGTGTDLPFLKVSREEGAANATGDKTITEKWIAYLPEYDNKNAGDDYACIKAKFNMQVGNDEPHTIYFSNYTNGKTDNDAANRLDIERNNLYRFHVKCTGYNYKLTLSVIDWFGSFDNVFEYGDGQVVSPVAPWDDEHDNDYQF